MHPNLFPTASSLFFVIVTIIFTLLIAIPPCFCQENDQYSTCGNLFDCANIQNIGYPFWGGDWPSYCGHSAFQLTNCQGDVPLITIDSISYRVLSLDEGTQSLTVSRADLYEEYCPTFFFNTTLDSTRFTTFSSNQNVALLYGCTLVPGQVTPSPNQFNCTFNGTISINYFMLEAALVSSNSVLCRSSVRVPVNATSAQALSSTGATTRDLQVALASGFGVQWNANNSLCNQCQGSSGRCGSNTTSNSFACYCADGVYDTRCNTTAQNGNRSSTNQLSVVLPLVGAILAGIGLGWLFFFCRQRKKRRLAAQTALIAQTESRDLTTSLSSKELSSTASVKFTRCIPKRWFKIGKKEEMDDKNVEAFLRNHGSLTPRRYAYSNIKKMTNSFLDKLGEGGYGSVFKGKLSDGRLVAVKLLSDADGDGSDFVNEVASISRTSHVNIVTLLGFCLEGNKRALVYEFMPNKSLDKFIGNKGSSSLDWETLYRIAVGTARGLEYLHRGCNTRIVHFDIKPENILLDEEFCPKISDFGLAKLCQRKKSIVSMLGARGTPGYIAPEVFCRNFGEVSHKSDVYSYGMMVINMVGVEKKTEVGSDLDSTSETYFPDFIYKRLELGKDLGVFQGLKSEEEEETARKMVMVSLWCIQTNPLDRPSMSKVVEMLEGSIDSFQVPPKPFLFSPIRANQDSCSALSSTSYEIELITRA